MAEEHALRIEHQINFRRQLRVTNDPFAISTTLFRSLYRMPQHLVMELANIIRPHIAPRQGHTYISLEIKVFIIVLFMKLFNAVQTELDKIFIFQLLCALSFYGHGSYQRPHARMADLNLSQPSVSNAISEVTDALNHPRVFAYFVRFPMTRQERDLVIYRCGLNVFLSSFFNPFCFPILLFNLFYFIGYFSLLQKWQTRPPWSSWIH